MANRDTTQLNARIDADLKQQFSKVCAGNAESEREVIERLITAYVTHEDLHGHMHLDGRLCPLSAMMNALSDALRAEIEGPAPDMVEHTAQRLSDAYKAAPR